MHINFAIIIFDSDKKKFILIIKATNWKIYFYIVEVVIDSRQIYKTSGTKRTNKWLILLHLFVFEL